MKKTTTISAKDLAPPTREWIKRVLNVEVTEGDEFTVTLHRPLSPDQQASARNKLMDALHRIDEKTSQASDAEMNEDIDQAFRALRSRKE